MALAVAVVKVKRLQFLFDQIIQCGCQSHLLVGVKAGIKTAVPEPRQHRLAVVICIFCVVLRDLTSILHDHKDARRCRDHCSRIYLFYPVIDTLCDFERNIPDSYHIADLYVLCGSDQCFTLSHCLVIAKYSVIDIHINEQYLRYFVIIDESKI